MHIVGLISGTSADGIEAAVVELSGAPPTLNWRLVKHLHVEHSQTLRDEILACVRPETGTVDRLCALNFALGEAFANAALQAIDAAGLIPAQIDLIGSHGQTLWHIPADMPNASTLQFGEPAVIAERTGITTIASFRTRDMAAGGHGAPLVAYVDTLLLSHSTLTRAAQNIGGIGNVTFLPPASNNPDDAQQPFAFDTGPGNMLIDYAASRATLGAWAFDHDGALAARGRVDAILLAELMREPYLKQAPPKTTGRELFGAHFGAQVWEKAQARSLRDEDILATLTAFTANSIAQAYRDFLPASPTQVIVSGGGAHNPVLMSMLRDQLAPAQVLRSDDLGLSSEAKEAIAFAVLAYETWFDRPGNLASATGARHPVVLGSLTPAFTQPSTDTHTLTESRNPATENIDTLSTLDMVRLMNQEDARVAIAVSAELGHIADAIDRITDRVQSGGRLIYLGAGTSGRLGVLDAAEIPPTFNVGSDRVLALIAGGEEAITRSIEGAEDDANAGAHDVASLNITDKDTVIGIAASGGTPYVLGGMALAKRHGALVVSIACNHPSPMEEQADLSIAPLVGAEAITGSTRLKAGTAEKMVLNLISTGIMVRLGKTFGNLMVDVQPRNSKLRKRARNIIETACHVSSAEAEELLTQCGGEVKTAIVTRLTHTTPGQARQRLTQAKGSVRAVLGN